MAEKDVFWKQLDPETGERNCVKFVRLALDVSRLQRARKRLLAEA